MPIRSFGITDVGLKRDHNEDSLLASDELGLYVVADGMGGHAAGEVASAKAVEVMRDFVVRCREDEDFTWPYGINPELDELQNTLVTAIKLANREVYRLAQEKAEQHGMGTTVASVHVNGDEMAVGHVGDSRVYLVRGGKMEQLTRDHSWVNEQLVRGIISPEEAKTHRWKNVITRALGNKEQIDVEISTIELKPDDIVLLCSDGLCAGDGVEEDLILQKILENEGDLASAGRVLIGLANDVGGRDNITVVLVKNFATEEAAQEYSRDKSDDDTNPVAIQSQAPPGVNIDSTAEMGKDFVDQVMGAAAANSEEDKLEQPIDFDDEEDTPEFTMSPAALAEAGADLETKTANPTSTTADMEAEKEAEAEQQEPEVQEAEEEPIEELEEPAEEEEEKVEAKKSSKAKAEVGDTDEADSDEPPSTEELSTAELSDVFEEDADQSKKE